MECLVNKALTSNSFLERVHRLAVYVTLVRTLK